MEHVQEAVRLYEEGKAMLVLGQAYAAIGRGYYLLGQLERR